MGNGASDIVAFGGDLSVPSLLAAYRSGRFPMPVADDDGNEVLAWWSPHPRAVIPLDGLVVSRSLARSRRRYRVSIDLAFAAVVEACAAPTRQGVWITDAVRHAYVDLHHAGWAHSVECWSDDGALAGGLYGVAIGGLFAGESMFHHRRDASKVALVHLVRTMAERGFSLLDVQWLTPHLAGLGAVELSRDEYLSRLAVAVDRPGPATMEP